MATSLKAPRARAAQLSLEGRAVLTYRQHLVTCILGTWMLGGLYLDGWAHLTLDLQDSITTPWHAVLYSGFLTFAAWLLWLVRRERKNGRKGLAAVVPGYGAGLVGVGIFAVGGVGDQFWHLAWGVEQDLNAFLSPTHWCLAIGMWLMVSSPLRAGWFEGGPQEPSLREFAPYLWSIALTTSMTQFFVNYLSTFVSDLPNVEPEFLRTLGADLPEPFLELTVERLRGLAVAMIIITTLVLMAMALHILRRWRTPAGTFTIVFTGTAAAVNAVWEYPFAWVTLSGLVGGITADLLVRHLDPRPSDVVVYRVFAGAVPAVMWLSYYGLMKIGYDLHWPAEMWTGTVVMASLASIVLSFLMRPAYPPALDGGFR